MSLNFLSKRDALNGLGRDDLIDLAIRLQEENEICQSIIGALKVKNAKEDNLDNQYLLVQLILEKEEYNNGAKQNYWQNIIRRCSAANRQEAIGRFVEETASIPAVQKFSIDCFDITKVIKL